MHKTPNADISISCEEKIIQDLIRFATKWFFCLQSTTPIKVSWIQLQKGCASQYSHNLEFENKSKKGEKKGWACQYSHDPTAFPRKQVRTTQPSICFKSQFPRKIISISPLRGEKYSWQPSQKSVDNYSASVSNLNSHERLFPFPLPPASLHISCFCRILDICCDAGEWWGIPMVPWLKPILRTLVAAMVTITKFLFLQNLDRCLRPGPNGPAGCQNFRHEIFKPATDLDHCHIWAPD